MSILPRLARQAAEKVGGKVAFPGEEDSLVSVLLERCKCLRHAKQVQALVLTMGQGQSSFLALKLIRFCQNKNIDYARLIFDHVNTRNVYLWTVMITAHAQQNTPSHSKSSVVLFTHMLAQGSQPNHFTFPFVLRACSHLSAIQECRQVHNRIFKSGFGGYTLIQTLLVDSYSKCSDIHTARQLFTEMSQRNVISWTAMISGYTRSGKMADALFLFEEMPERDVPSWNSIISGFTQNGFFSQAISMFRRMLNQQQQQQQRPNQITVVCVLSACGHLGALQLGNWIHGFVHKSGFGPDSCIIGNALVDMYGKCGSLNEARKVFDGMPERTITSWNSMINSFALHGQYDDAILIFKEMDMAGLEPDEITFVGLLNACSHGGLVDEGRRYFVSMDGDYGIEPRIEHYGCVIDLLGRAGRFEEAMEVIKGMRVKADEVVWGSLLNSCRIHGNVELAECSVRHLLEIDPGNAAHCVVLANIYGECGRWKDVGRTRVMMKTRGLQKTPGCSWIEVDNEVHNFFSVDNLHPASHEIFRLLDGLVALLKLDGEVCGLENVPVKN